MNPYPERDDLWRLDGDIVRVLEVHTNGLTPEPDPVDVRHSDGLERSVLVGELMDRGTLVSHTHRYVGTSYYPRGYSGMGMLVDPYVCRCGERQPIDRSTFDWRANLRAARAAMKRYVLVTAWSTSRASGHYDHHTPEYMLKVLSQEGADAARRRREDAAR